MPWPSYGNAYAGIPGPSPGVALETYRHNGTSWVLSPYYAHRDGAWRLISVYRLPADLDPEVPPTETTTVIALTDLLVSGESLGTVNDSVVLARCIQRAATRTGPATGIDTEYVTVDFEGQTYVCEDPMNFVDLGPRFLAPNLKTIIHGNVSNPAVKGGTVANTFDGLNPTRWTGTGTNVPLPGTDGSGATRKYRNRNHWGFRDCQHITFDSFKVTGPNTNGPFDSNFYYDVQREAQHAFALNGTQNFRLIDCDVSQTFGDVIFLQPDRPAGGSKSDDVYPGNIEALGGEWKKIGRIYVTMNQVRAPDGLVDRNWWMNPGDGTGLYEGGRNALPYSNDAPSIFGAGYGVWWHGNAAHPFAGKGCKRSVVDIENMNSYAHCTDVRIGADTEQPFFPNVDRQNFHLTGPGGNLISGINGWGLIHRFTISRLWRTGAAGMSIRIHGSEEGPNGPETTSIAASMHNVPSSPMPTTIAVASTAGWPTSGYFEVGLGIFANDPVRIGYTGIAGNSFTGCTRQYGASTQPFIQSRTVTRRYNLPERPKYVCSTFSLLDCLFDGSSASLFELRRVVNASVRRNRANYRAGNNEIEFTDCPGLDLGTGGTWGDNDFRST